MPVLLALDFSPYDILHTFTMFTLPYRKQSHIFHQRHSTDQHGCPVSCTSDNSLGLSFGLRVLIKFNPQHFQARIIYTLLSYLYNPQHLPTTLLFIANT